MSTVQSIRYAATTKILLSASFSFSRLNLAGNGPIASEISPTFEGKLSLLLFLFFDFVVFSRFSLFMMADLSSFGFCMGEILNDEDWLWMIEEQCEDFVRVMGVFGLWPTRVRVLVMKVEQGGSSSGCSMKVDVE
ncbi:hypothetical protein V6N13_062272 [Hibiscus sabdariffa]|uniref:Uncharacterized protein n=2 Tax=Hibiscus sabdariffa TaxID=183260 RepID=A0ABR2NIY4_9ROSI